MDSMTLAVVGAAYGTSIAIGVSRNAWLRRSRSDALLALLTGCAVGAILTIVLQHRFGHGIAVALLERIEYIATLASGPVLFLYVASLSDGAESRPADLLHFIPALAAALVPAALSVPIGLLLLHQVAYTAAATLLRVRLRVATPRHGTISCAILATMAMIHLSQLIRMTSRGSHRFVDVVPLTASIAILGGGALALFLWIGMAPPQRRAKRRDAATATPTNGDRILGKIERLMREEHLYRRGDLGLHDLAQAIEVTPHELSAALNATARVGLLEFLARFRLEDAKRRLTDPGHAIYTIEAIGQMSGFGSRSSFHAVFRRQVGTTPSRYRSLHLLPSD